MNGYARPFDVLRLARLMAAIAVAATLVELLLGRGVLFLGYERARAGLPVADVVLLRASPHVTILAGLLAAGAAGALGALLAVSPIPPIARALGIALSVAAVTLGLATLIFPPGVRGILTVHSTVALGGLLLGASLMPARAPLDLKLLVLAALLLPVAGTMSSTFGYGGWIGAGLRTSVHVMAAIAAVTAAAAVFRRCRSDPPAVRLGGLLGALVVGCGFAAAALAQPRRVAEFALLSHGVALDYPVAMALGAAVLVAVAFAALSLVLASARPGTPCAGRDLLACGLVLAVSAGPLPISTAQTMMLAASTLALAAGLPDRAGAGGAGGGPDADAVESPPPPGGE